MAARKVLTTAVLTLACASLWACDQPTNPAPPKAQAAPKPAESNTRTTPANPTLSVEKVVIAGKTFKLELAATNEHRFQVLLKGHRPAMRAPMAGCSSPSHPARCRSRAL